MEKGNDKIINGLQDKGQAVQYLDDLVMEETEVEGLHVVPSAGLSQGHGCGKKTEVMDTKNLSEIEYWSVVGVREAGVSKMALKLIMIYWETNDAIYS